MSQRQNYILCILGILCNSYSIYTAPVQPPAGFIPGEIRISPQTWADIQKTFASLIITTQKAGEETVTHSATEAIKLTDHIETSCNRVIHTTIKDLSEIIKEASEEVANNLQITHEQTTNTVLRVSLIVAGVVCAYYGLQDISNSISSKEASVLLKQGCFKLLTGTGITATGYNLNGLLNLIKKRKKSTT